MATLPPLGEMLAEKQPEEGRIIRWERPACSTSMLFLWVCFCGAGMRYFNKDAMIRGSLLHVRHKHKKD